MQRVQACIHIVIDNFVGYIFLNIHFFLAIFFSFICQDEDFVVEKDDGGSPTDDSDEEESDASESGDEKEVRSILLLANCEFNFMGITKAIFYMVSEICC